MSQGTTGPDEVRQLQHSAKEAVRQAMADLGIATQPPSGPQSHEPRRSVDALGATAAGPVRKMVLVDKGDGVSTARPRTRG